MAAARLIGGESAGCLVVPLLGLLVLAVSAATAWELGGAWAASAASLLVVTSPTLLAHLVQPMSDVPAATFWTAALWLAWRGGGLPAAIGARLAAGAAVLVRPNWRR